MLVMWWKVIIVSALSLSLRDKDRYRDWEIERAWQYIDLENRILHFTVSKTYHTANAEKHGSSSSYFM